MADRYASAEEIEARGEENYAKQIRAQVETQHRGEYLVMDVQTGDYEIDVDDLVATKRMLARRPNAVLYGLRIGYRTAYRVG